MNLSFVVAVLGMVILGSACAPSASTNGGCLTQGLFADQASCGAATGTTCVMTTPTPKEILPIRQDRLVASEVPSAVVFLSAGKHSSDECVSGGGKVADLKVDGMGVDKICNFPFDKCPSGWSTFGETFGAGLAYTMTARSTDQKKTWCGLRSSEVSTGFHDAFLQAIPVESMEFCSYHCSGICAKKKTIFAKVVQIACY